MTETDTPEFAIRIDPPRRYVEIEMRGYWDAEVAARFDRELRRLLPALPLSGCAMGDQVTLFDITAYAVQSQDVLGSLAQMAADQSIASRKIAILASSALLKMQARRIAPGYELFSDRAEALAWLFGDD